MSDSTGDASEPDLEDAAAPRAPPSGARLRRPPASSATFGVLTDRPDDELRSLADRAVFPGLLTPDLCGAPSACNAVRSTLEDEHATSVTVMPVADWSFGVLDADAGAQRLPPADRVDLGRRAHVVSVRVSTATSPRQLALRAAIAGAAAIARKLSGLVDDPLLGRIETWGEFARHAVIEPLEASTFRRDRVGVIVEPREEAVVRIVTAGLARWGAPDVEAARVPSATQEAATEILLGVAAAVANGLEAGPCLLSMDNLRRARGESGPSDAASPPPTAVSVDLVSVQAETGDANDFVARISPPGGEGPLAYLELAERFFGPFAGGTQNGERDHPGVAKGRLVELLARWSAEQGRGVRLAVALPFAIPGDAGTESMWVDVTRYDSASVSGTLLDDPLGATDHARGETVTQPRSEVLDVRLTRVGDSGGAGDRSDLGDR